MANYTWQQIKDHVGDPIVLITFRHPATKKVIEFTTDMLPPAAQQALLDWINARLP